MEMKPNTLQNVKCTPNTLFLPVLHLLFYISYLGLVFLVNLNRGWNFVCHLRFNFLSLSSISKWISDILSASHCAFLQLYICLDCTILWTQLSWNRIALMHRQSERSQSCSFNHVGFPLSNSWWLSSYRKWIGSSGTIITFYHVFSFFPNFSSKVTAWVAFPMLTPVKKMNFYFSFSSLWQDLKPVFIVQLTMVECIFTTSGTN